MILNDLIQELEILAPAEYAMSWDNSGLLVGHRGAQISSVYITLDASGESVEQAVKEGCNLILAHHPLIFSPLKSVTGEDFIGKRILKMAENHIALYAMHTNFDTSVMGKIVADRISQVTEGPLEPVVEENGVMLGIGSVGTLLHPMSLGELGRQIKELFHLPEVRLFGDPAALISRIAICPGSGKGMSDEALRAGCEVLITGDIDHHGGIDSVEKGLCVIDAGHHGLEHIFVEYMAGWMSKHHPEIRVVKDANHSPFSVL